MSSLPPRTLHRRFFRLWIAALFLLAALLLWAFFALQPGGGNAPGTAEAPTAPPAANLPKAIAPGFDPENGKWLLTAVCTEGLRQVGDALPVFTLLPPGNVLVAQLIARDTTPEPFDAERARGIRVRYSLDEPYAAGNRGAASGDLLPSASGAFFTSAPISVMPYLENGVFAPYPTALVEALDENGTVLAQTRVVLPVSTETGCRNCHTGPWKTADAGGISKTTAEDILAVHDRRVGTDLQKRSAAGHAPECRSCHTGQGQAPGLSTAVHGFHATMRLEGAEACGRCHASSEQGNTRFFRDFHDLYGLDCTRCHGSLEQHAFALVRFDADKGNGAAAKRLTQLAALLGDASRDIAPREAYVNMPHCFGCHNLEQKPDAGEATAFNKWTETADKRFSRSFENMGKVRCVSCHGAPHALYPSSSPAGDDRDNLQPLQYQKMAAPLGADNNCAVCHVEPIDFFVHHDRPE